jgi:peptide deformylase
MAVCDILEYPDPRLRERSLPVEVFDDQVRRVAADLIETLHDSKSIGLSAPQIDVRQRVLVMDHSEDQTRPEVYINPEITGQRRYGLVEERCLSVPGIVTNVLRATEIRVRAQDTDGNVFERELNGMQAVCLQHEIDHFEGKMLSDRINWFRRRRLDAAVAKARAAA